MQGWLRDERGYSLVWWALFFAAVLGALMTLGVEASRYARARGELQKAADLAAVAAAQMVDVPYFRETGEIVFSPEATAVATEVFNYNLAQLSFLRIRGSCRGPYIDEAEDTVRVVCQGNVDRIFHWIPVTTITVEGTAQARARAR